MKRIDEAQLLLAVGEVGDDLLLRAERSPVSSARQHWRQWGTLAACFCLVLVLAAALQLPDMLRMGSSNSSGVPMEPTMSESANANDEAGETADGAAPGDMDGVQYGDTAGQAPQDSAGSASGKCEAALDGADCLAELGITGAADITDYFTTQKTADGDETARENRTQQFYEALAAATVVFAEDEQTFLPSVEGTLALSSGDSLTFLYDPEHGALELGAYHFYNQDFSRLLGGE